MEYKKKIIIAHPGKQHSFRLAKALSENDNFDVTYITTVYNKKSSMLMRILLFFAKGDNMKRAYGRKIEGFEDENVVQFCELSGIIEALLSRCKKKGFYHRWRNYTSVKFGKKVAKYASVNKYDAVICYNTNSRHTFNYLKNNSPDILRILDSAAANPVFMKHIYIKEMHQNLDFSKKLESEIGYLLNDKIQSYAYDEATLANHILVASQFVKTSFRFSGVEASRIHICPYGVDLTLFKSELRSETTNNKPLNVVFVGGTKQVKGLSYLLDAFEQIPGNVGKLTIVGVNNLSNDMKKKYEKIVTFTGYMRNDEVSTFLQTMDLMVFPSLGDGFGLSGLEAMACGCPLICSENTGVSDIIINGHNGFVIPIQDSLKIVELVNWFNENRDELFVARRNAINSARSMSWETYQETIVSTIRSILAGNTYE